MMGWGLHVGPLTWELQVWAVRTTGPDAPVTNLQYIKDNDADQSA